MNTHAINWFEIPVLDFARAKKFYSAIYDYEMPEMEMDGVRMGILLYDMQNGGRGGAIVHNPEFYKPSENGTLVYLNADPDLDVVLGRIRDAGGKVLQEKTEIPQIGYWAMFLDSEGNRVGLHSEK